MGLPNHQQQVAYLAYQLARRLGWSDEAVKKVFLAALVHDIGALSLADSLQIIEDVTNFAQNHATKGAALLAGFAPFTELAPIVRYHHYP